MGYIDSVTAQAFTRNYRDHSNDTGFQFEFFCDRCGNGYRSPFRTSALGVGAKVLQGLGSLFSGTPLWNAGYASDHVKDILRGGAWDEAFAGAIHEMRPKFRHCTRCGQWVCPEACWNEERQMCEECAPNLAEEATAAQARIAADQLADKMRDVDQAAGIDASARMQSHCPSCSARVALGAKFCATCGKPIAAATGFCPGCGAKTAANARFCPECGAAVTAQAR